MRQKVERTRGLEGRSKKVARMPVAYGALLGLLFQLIDLSLPKELMTGVQLVGDATIPTIMLILGMRLAVISFKQVDYRNISYAVFAQAVYFTSHRLWFYTYFTCR